MVRESRQPSYRVPARGSGQGRPDSTLPAVRTHLSASIADPATNAIAPPSPCRGPPRSPLDAKPDSRGPARPLVRARRPSLLLSPLPELLSRARSARGEDRPTPDRSQAPANLLSNH